MSIKMQPDLVIWAFHLSLKTLALGRYRGAVYKELRLEALIFKNLTEHLLGMYSLHTLLVFFFHLNKKIKEKIEKTAMTQGLAEKDSILHSVIII